MKEQIHTGVFKRNRNPSLKRVRPYIPGPTSADVSAKYDIPIEKLVKLSSNEAPLGPSPSVREALKKVAESDDLHRYPSSAMPKLRAAAAHAIGVLPEQIVLGAGSSDTWGMIIRAFSRPGDEVLAIEPSMTSYLEAAVLLEREPVEVIIESPFDITTQAVLKSLTGRTRVVFLSSPNNSTSRLISPDVITRIAQGAPDAVIVVDEHYIEASDRYRDASAVRLIGELDNLLVTRSLSKMYGLAGLRIGYAAGPAEAIATVMSFKPKWNVSITAEKAALAALAANDHLEANIKMTREGRSYLLAELSKLPVEVVPGAQGGFVLFKPRTQSGNKVTEGLFSRGYMVRGDLVKDHIRVSVGTPAQNQGFVQALASLL